jgi:sterol desaturase/sphingolipid hydroxylase (fatty acid hydroxylase superfamily)
MGMESEGFLRLSIFISAFAVLAVAEALWPRRPIAARRQRWVTNIALVVFNTAVLRLSFLIFPALTVIAAVYVEGQGWGLLPALGVTGAVGVVIAFVALDLAIYAQHVAFHFVPVFWRLHRVHHADIDFDVTTGVRFHIGEILLSQVWKVLVVLVLGAPAISVLAFEIALNATSMFSHSNLHLWARLDRWLRVVTVTPEMHRVHHSIVEEETNSNFGFNLSVWDRLFGTYRASALGDQAQMPIGLGSYRGPEPSRFLWSMAFPLAVGPRA